MTHEDIEIISKAGFYIAATMGVQDPSPIYRVLATSEHRDLSGTLQTKVIDITDQITTLLELLGKEHTQEPEPHLCQSCHRRYDFQWNEPNPS